MFCKNCGQEISDDAISCSNCGFKINEEQNAKPIEEKQKANICSIIGFILSILSLLLALWGTVAIAGLILSIIGIYQCNTNNERLKELGIAGLIISIISLAYTTYSLIILLSII